MGKKFFFLISKFRYEPERIQIPHKATPLLFALDALEKFVVRYRHRRGVVGGVDWG